MLAGSFAHHAFRPLVRCDLVRVAVALILLCSLDIETRGFISFTYLVVVFATAVMALVCLERRPVLPWLFWTLPVLMVPLPSTVLPSRKVTLPLGVPVPLGETVAVKLSVVPYVMVAALAASVVPVVACVTCSGVAELNEPV